MDEPFGSLDSQTRFLMQDQLLDILDEFRTTTIFVTHDISEALYLGDRVVLLSAHPARILDVLDLGFRADRKLGQDPRHTEEFVRLSAQIWSTMRQLAQRG